MATAAEAARWKRKTTIADAASSCCSQAAKRAMDLLQGPSTPSPRPRSCLAVWRFGSASAGRGEDDDRDLSAGALRLSCSMDGDDRHPTLELDSEIVRPDHHDSPQNKICARQGSKAVYNSQDCNDLSLQHMNPRI
ncbi:uncharacterized protein [Triticum aestivum]|uniref:uncharacterized protein isoform X1 n=1 Tax=Triticum aestivum TaxID=4565 RepID=UPI001D015B22|nr:uncharacterized protein LOC123191182 isoform X1 [Triticum aestivum]